MVFYHPWSSKVYPESAVSLKVQVRLVPVPVQNMIGSWGMGLHRVVIWFATRKSDRGGTDMLQ
jgi:hypothetical protein